MGTFKIVTNVLVRKGPKNVPVIDNIPTDVICHFRSTIFFMAWLLNKEPNQQD